MNRRKAVIVLESNITEGGYVPSVVYEGGADSFELFGWGEHARPWVWGPTFQQALDQAAQANALLGLSPEDVKAITDSFITAALAREVGK